ncbi:type II toxin-antitoxin system VapC family toxin [Lacipirellula parvula]|uniref:PIN domain-containing protein n=1 Tax=Lacipirellula parvula TaxID=2650471 RepID=A0A5K7XM76_9BACT|nr:PIN domain-containing protein [Lacipirellula parvula]BBO36531.1 hypothetical protein PLANPX_6143 [Lacipirellula parvula]
MKPIFLDSVGLVALWLQADQWHQAARGVFGQMLVSRRRVVTTSLVLCECGNAVARKPARQDVIRLRSDLLANKGLIIPTQDDWDKGWQQYDQGRPGDPGIVDCISFAIMRRLGLTEVFTNDQHFAAAGFTPLF